MAIGGQSFNMRNNGKNKLFSFFYPQMLQKIDIGQSYETWGITEKLVFFFLLSLIVRQKNWHRRSVIRVIWNIGKISYFHSFIFNCWSENCDRSSVIRDMRNNGKLLFSYFYLQLLQKIGIGGQSFKTWGIMRK